MEKVVKKIASKNYNGIYTIYKLPGGEYACDCLSFLTQKVDLDVSFPFATCKHIKRYLLNKTNKQRQMKLFLPANEEQVEELKVLGVKAFSKLTFNQAEFIILKLLEKQGIEREEFRKMVFSKFFPMRYYGVELEGGIGVSRWKFREILEENGFESIVCGYDHKLYNNIWKLGEDRSIRVTRLNPVELVSPKLHGYEGLKKIEKILQLWKSTLTEDDEPVNYTCGFHIHVDAYGWNFDVIYNLMMLWAKIEVPVIHRMIHYTRRDNFYTRPISEHILKEVIYKRLDFQRYYSLNVTPLERQNTVEFRHVEGTLRFEKIQAWIVFAVLLVDAVFNGLKHREVSVNPSFDEIMEAIGMRKDAVPVIRKAREFLEKKYFEEKSYNKVSLINFSFLEKKYYWFKYHMGEKLTDYDDRMLLNSINNLASFTIPQTSVVSPFVIGVAHDAWYVPGGDIRYKVRKENDLLFCECEDFQKHNYCYHSINIARLLVTYQNLETLRLTEEKKYSIQ